MPQRQFVYKVVEMLNTGQMFKWQSKKVKTNLCALSIRQSKFWPISFLMLSMNREEMKNWFYNAIRQELM